MRVAILLVGLTRSYMATHRSFFNKFLKAKNDYDIFVSTWNIQGSIKQPKVYSNNISEDDWINQFDKINKKHIDELYSPELIAIENYRKWKEKIMPKVKDFSDIFNSKEHTRVLNSIMAQFYKLKKCYDIYKLYERNNSVKYDLVIKCRFDLKFNNPIDINEDILRMSQNGVVCPSYWFPDGRSDYMNDQIAIGTPETMSKYCQMYDNLFNVAKEMDHEKMAYPEELLANLLIRNNIEIKILEMDYEIVR